MSRKRLTQLVTDIVLDRQTGMHYTAEAAGPASSPSQPSLSYPWMRLQRQATLTWEATLACQWQQPSQVPEHGLAAAASRTPGAAQQSRAQALP